MKPSLRHFSQLRWWAVPVLLVIVLGLLGGMIWRNFDRLETMRAYVIYAHRIQAVAADIQASLTDYFLAENRDLRGEQLARLTHEIIDLAKNDHHVAPETPAKLHSLRDTVRELTDKRASDEAREALLLRALSITNAIMDAETLHREALLEDVSQSTRMEIVLVFATVLVLLVLVALFVRYRILAPLNDLRQLLLRLAEADYSPMDIQKIDPVILPIFKSYNVMVKHLAELEETKRLYAESLEGDVRSATSALLEQQAGLARNERLAAVGELAAGIAHELRNPLAGIQMSCVNLRSEFADEDKSRRMSLIIEELKRMGRLLNELLDLSKHTPAPLVEFNLPTLVLDLVGLLRYQIDPKIELLVKAPEEIRCRLPESRIRQSLLNLILNSAEALGDAQGQIEIQVRSESIGRVRIEIVDSGPGFSEEMLKNGIRPFSTGKASGTGLGLAMVQRFVRELGGQMRLDRNVPQGARVILELPVSYT